MSDLTSNRHGQVRTLLILWSQMFYAIHYTGKKALFMDIETFFDSDTEIEFDVVYFPISLLLWEMMYALYKSDIDLTSPLLQI